MFKIAIVGFGSIGSRYFEAINKIKIFKIKFFIVDKKIKPTTKHQKLNGKNINASDNLKIIPKKVDLCIISTTCQNRHTLLKKIINKSKFKNLIIEKPLTQSPNELLELDNILKGVKNVWVNTDNRSQDIYKFIQSKINLKYKLSMSVKGNSWGICCNSLHYVDLFNFLSKQRLHTIKEISSISWFPAKRKGFQEIDNAKLKLKFGDHELYLLSKKNSLPKNTRIFIKNRKTKFFIKVQENNLELNYNNKNLFFKNELLSIKMTRVIKKILLKNESKLPTYQNSSKLYFPLINFFLKKWQTKFPKSRKVPIT